MLNQHNTLTEAGWAVSGTDQWTKPCAIGCMLPHAVSVPRWAAIVADCVERDAYRVETQQWAAVLVWRRSLPSEVWHTDDGFVLCKLGSQWTDGDMTFDSGDDGYPVDAWNEPVSGYPEVLQKIAVQHAEEYALSGDACLMDKECLVGDLLDYYGIPRRFEGDLERLLGFFSL